MKPFAIMKRFIIPILSVISVFSCSAPRHITQAVRDIRHDSASVWNIRYDSIYVYQSHESEYRPDTVFIKDVSVEYRYRMLRDTVRIVTRDSIPYPVTIVETRETARPLTRFDRMTRFSFWLLMGTAAAFLFIKTRRVLKKH